MNANAEELLVADTDTENNDFRAWMKSMGFNGKQVSQAGEMIGLQTKVSTKTGRGERELSETEHLAMSAVTAGLPAWSRETAAELEAVRTLYSMLKSEIASTSNSSAEAESVRTIKALIRSEAIRIATDRSAPAGQDQETDQAILSLLRAFAHGSNAR